MSETFGVFIIPVVLLVFVYRSIKKNGVKMWPTIIAFVIGAVCFVGGYAVSPLPLLASSSLLAMFVTYLIGSKASQWFLNPHKRQRL